MSLHLQQAEEDRNIAWQLVERLMATINIENDDMEELQDKREALNRASKRLEEKTTRLELRPMKARISMEERLHATESHEAQAMAVDSMMRQIAGKVHRRKNMESNQSGYRFTGIRLPKIDLKTFDGNLMRWHEFWECFEHVVHHNQRCLTFKSFST